MTSGTREVDVGGEGPNCRNNALDHQFEHSTAVLEEVVTSTTLHPFNGIYVMSKTRPSLFLLMYKRCQET